MGETKMGSVTVQFDTRVPAVYVYLKDPIGFQSSKSKKIAPGVVVDLDEEGKLIGVELLGPGSLEVVFRKVIPEYKAKILRQLEPKRRLLEEILSSTAA